MRVRSPTRLNLRGCHVGRILRTSGTLIGFLLVILYFWANIPNTFMTLPN